MAKRATIRGRALAPSRRARTLLMVAARNPGALVDVA